MKKVLLLLCLIITMIGVSGCMNSNSNQYKEQITIYLEQKYDEKFQIEKMIRRVEVEEADVILAQCYSEKYPAELFDVIYHLSGDDVYKKDEIIDLLKESGTYDESKLNKWENEIEPYFEDNYTNIIRQHQFDKEVGLPVGINMVTRINTPNYYPDASDATLSLSEYYDIEDCDVVCYNYIFIADTREVDEDEILAAVVNNKIKNQYVNIIYTNKSFNDCLNLYYKNYEFPFEVFEQDEDTKAIKNHVFRYGK